MYKGLVALFLVCAVMAASPLADMKTVIQGDVCAANKMEALKPQMQVQIELLKENKFNLAAKTELVSLIQQAKAVFEECQLDKKVQPTYGDIIEATGISFLLASNCFKDVGVVFLLLDTVVQDPTDWTNDIIILIFGAILGNQGYKDCSQFVNFIIG